MAVAVQPGLAAALASCSGPASTLDPAGPAAGSIATLWWVMLAGAAVLFALVMVLFVLVIRRPGWGSGVSTARWIVLTASTCLFEPSPRTSRHFWTSIRM